MNSKNDKHLFLLRHAKSDWSSDTITDEERPLAPRGRRAAATMGKFVLRNYLQPDFIICSTARRTVDTAQILCAEWKVKPTISFEPRLYGASKETIWEQLSTLPENIASVMVVGHHPGIHEIALFFAAQGDSTGFQHLTQKFPTAALAYLRFDIGYWSQLSQGSGSLEAFTRPKDLSGRE